MTGAAAGGFGVGFIEKNWGDQIPSLPLVGRKGAIALAIYMFRPKSRLIQDIGISAAAIAGYELGLKGSISGVDSVMGEDEFEYDDDDELYTEAA